MYGEIVSRHENYLVTDDAEKSIRLFDELLSNYVALTPVKKADFLLRGKR